MKDYIGFVYMWINKLNGKKYIGKHKGKIEDGYIGSGTIFKQAVEKYGLENFERVILYYEYDNEENLSSKECEIINEMNAVFSSDYYNLVNIKGGIIGNEAREKMSKSGKRKNSFRRI